MKTQNNRILNHLKKGNSITPISALNKFGSFRLSARIYDLREDGHNIETRYITREGKTYASYRLVK